MSEVERQTKRRKTDEGGNDDVDEDIILDPKLLLTIPYDVVLTIFEWYGVSPVTRNASDFNSELDFYGCTLAAPRGSPIHSSSQQHSIDLVAETHDLFTAADFERDWTRKLYHVFANVQQCGDIKSPKQLDEFLRIVPFSHLRMLALLWVSLEVTPEQDRRLSGRFSTCMELRELSLFCDTRSSRILIDRLRVKYLEKISIGVQTLCDQQESVNEFVQRLGCREGPALRLFSLFGPDSVAGVPPLLFDVGNFQMRVKRCDLSSVSCVYHPPSPSSSIPAFGVSDELILDECDVPDEVLGYLREVFSGSLLQLSGVGAEFERIGASLLLPSFVQGLQRGIAHTVGEGTLHRPSGFVSLALGVFVCDIDTLMSHSQSIDAMIPLLGRLGIRPRLPTPISSVWVERLRIVPAVVVLAVDRAELVSPECVESFARKFPDSTLYWGTTWESKTPCGSIE